MPLTPIPEILEELRAGRMVILTDDEHRENEGGLILPGSLSRPRRSRSCSRWRVGIRAQSLTPKIAIV